MYISWNKFSSHALAELDSDICCLLYYDRIGKLDQLWHAFIHRFRLQHIMIDLHFKYKMEVQNLTQSENILKIPIAAWCWLGFTHDCCCRKYHDANAIRNALYSMCMPAAGIVAKENMYPGELNACEIIDLSTSTKSSCSTTSIKLMIYSPLFIRCLSSTCKVLANCCGCTLTVILIIERKRKSW